MNESKNYKGNFYSNKSNNSHTYKNTKNIINNLKISTIIIFSLLVVIMIPIIKFNSILHCTFV